MGIRAGKESLIGSRPDTVTGSSVDRGALRTCVDAIAATTCGLLAAFGTSALAPVLRADGIVTPARLGVAVAVFFTVSAIVAPLGGRLADRIGSVRVMRSTLLLSAVSLAVVGGVVHSWIGLTVALGLAGATNGAIQPSANRYLSRLIPPHRQGLAFGVKQAAIPAAILLGGLSVPVATGVTGWRSIYLAGAVLAIVVALTIRKPPPGGPQPPRTREAAAAPGHTEPASRALPRRALLVLATGWALASAGANGLGAFFVLGAVHAGYSVVAAGMLAVLGSLASISTRVGIGFVADRWAGKGFGIVAAMTGAGSAGIALLATGQAWAFIAAALLGYGIGWGWAGLFNYAVVRTDPRNPGRTTGITQAGAGTGACLGPLAFGFVVTHSGYTLGWLLAAATLLLASAVVLAGRAMLPSHPPTGV